MASPPTTARVTPTMFKVPEGYRATIAFSKNTMLGFWEVEFKPGGISGGPAIDTTTQHNSRRKTKAAPYLIEDKPIEGTAAFDPDFLDDIDAMVNDDYNSAITVYYPNGMKKSWWAYLADYEVQPFKIGQMPALSFKIEITNWDWVTNTEAGPTTTEAVGT